MQLLLKREKSSEFSTIGSLFVDGVFECYTLEDVVRDKKIYGQTAIPAGTYKVSISFSNRFKRDLPILLNVPNYEGVRIHPGNTSADTEGCILVGESRSKDFIGNSKKAFDKLFLKIKGKDVTLTIEAYHGA